MKRLLTILILLASLPTMASHYIGGEITWTCANSGPNSGKFKFYVVLYRECGTGASTFLPNPVVLSTNAPGGIISCAQVGAAVDISPDCWDSSQEIACNSVTSGNGAVEMRKYESGWVQINGVPPAGGWYFSFTDCCRPSTTNLTSSSSSYTLRAYMYPYTVQGSAQNSSSCYDNAPRFLEPPVTVVSSTSPSVTNFMGYDKDYDSVVYEWAYPQTTSNGTNASFSGTYSYNNPFPSSSPIVLDQSNGQLSFTPNALGTYTYCIGISSYRDGQKIASTFRDCILVVGAANSTNTPPSINVDKASPQQTTLIPQLNFPDSTYYEFNVTAGDSVRFSVVGSDVNLLPSFIPQSVTWKGTSGQIGSTSTTGCDNPPCAVVSPGFGQTGFTSPLTSVARVDWLTDCNNTILNGVPQPTVKYIFIAKFIDNACVIPGSTSIPIVVNVNAPTLGSPDSLIASPVSISSTLLSWVAPSDTSTVFNGYEVLHSQSLSGPFAPIDTISNYQQTQAFLNPQVLGGGYATIRTLGPCQVPSANSDTVQIQFCVPNFVINTPQADTAYTATGTKMLFVGNPSCINQFQWQIDDGTSFTWMDLVDNSTYSGANNDSLNINGISTAFNGFKYRCIASGTGVNDTSDVTTLFVVDNITIAEFGTDEAILTPNPNNGKFVLSVNPDFIGSSYEIVDEMGRRIERGEVLSLKQGFDLTDKPKGVYRITLTGKSASKTMIVVLQ